MGNSRGRKPKPTAIKIADGTFRADRHGGYVNEIHQEPLKELPSMPQVLGDVGREKWLALAEAMLGLGVLEERYLPTLLIYGQAWDRKSRAENQIALDGEYQHALTGAISRHPGFNVIRECEDRICRIMSEIGFTPSSSVTVHKSVTKKTGIASRGKIG